MKVVFGERRHCREMLQIERLGEVSIGVVSRSAQVNQCMIRRSCSLHGSRIDRLSSGRDFAPRVGHLSRASGAQWPCGAEGVGTGKNEGVSDIRSVVVCAQCEVHWSVGDEPPKCTAPDHDHQRLDLHLHRSVVVLPDGTEVTAVSFDARDPYARHQVPDFGLYLDPHWNPPWPHDHLDWPDFGVPSDSAPVVGSLRSLRERARSGERVELGCLGGHGRTGTALACLAILCGHAPSDAVTWVRENYCSSAVESGQQEAFVDGFVG